MRDAMRSGKRVMGELSRRGPEEIGTDKRKKR
jgi:hypothetical protein